MAVVPITRVLPTDTFVNVHWDLKETNVSWIFDHVKWILAGTTVCLLYSHKLERIYVIISGTCLNKSMSEFSCLCPDGWTGIRCETIVNYCHNITCQNQGVCRPLFRDYKCECSTSSYSGRHCEIVASSLIARKAASKSLAFIAILCVSFVIGVVVILDGLKYIFRIDPTRPVRERLRRQRATQKNKQKKKPPVIVRHKYIDRPPEISTVEETV